MPDNDLAVLPAAIANLINLRELDVSKNSKQDDSFVEPFCFKAWKLSFEISNVETVFCCHDGKKIYERINTLFRFAFSKMRQGEMPQHV